MYSCYGVLPLSYSHDFLSSNVLFIRKRPVSPSFKEIAKSSLLRKYAILTFLLCFLIYVLFNFASINISYYFSKTVQSALALKEIITPSIRPKIAIITFFTLDKNSQAMKALSFPNFKEYAARHGYDVIDALDVPEILAFFKNDYSSSHASILYFKYFAISFIIPHYDWIMWADGDSLFLNQSIPISTLIDNNPFDIIVTVNPLFDSFWAKILNSGHFLVHNSEWTLTKFLPLINRMGTSCNNFLDSLNSTTSTSINGFFNYCNRETGQWWLDDQGVFQWLLDNMPSTFQCHIQRRGFRDFNSEYPWYYDGDFILHFPGKPHEEKMSLLELVLKRADFNSGTIDRTELPSGLLAPESEPRNAPGMYDEFYAILNNPCK